MAASPDLAARTPGGSARRDDSRRAITRAALDLFERQGYAATTVDAIAESAGVARRTFFHHFPTKDAVVFPDHEALVAQVAAHLAERPDDPPLEAVGGALRLVLSSYLADPEVAVRRYRLARQTPELREREIAWVHRYQLAFSRYLGTRYSAQPQGDVAAEVVASGLVALHNHVLRHWLSSGGAGDALDDLDDALAWYTRSVGQAQRPEGRQPRLVVAVFDDDVDPQEVARHVREARRRT